ncbi:MAG: rhomboid family intramembrane serine protease [Planctomycetota bacterium]|nr:MAG: rhomboid family intramembrane serine protease [Planctomycetota bacterium]
MGIYDREYVRVGPRSSSGMGAVRVWSVNTWIIVICIAVFVLDGLLFGGGFVVPVNMGDAWVEGATPAQIERARPVTTSDRQGLPASRSLRGARAVPLIDPQTRQVIGERRVYDMPPLMAVLHFSTGKAFLGLEIWRFIGFQFLHGSVGHIFFNMLGLYFFGGLVENYLGPKRYLAFYLTCGVFGAVSYLLLNLLGNVLPFSLPGLLINDVYTPLIGASAGVFGVLVAAAFVAPNAIVLLFFILPMKLWQVAYGFVALAALNLLLSGHNAGGDAAHLGGALAGFYFIRHTHLLRDFFDVFSVSGRRSKARPPRGPTFRNRKTPDDTEIDRILAKIATQGLHSLSEAEKRALRAATEARRR